jgi:hypothetical protein
VRVLAALRVANAALAVAFAARAADDPHAAHRALLGAFAAGLAALAVWIHAVQLPRVRRLREDLAAAAAPAERT